MCDWRPWGAHAREQIPGEPPISQRWLAHREAAWPLGCWLWALKGSHRISPWTEHWPHQLDKLSFMAEDPSGIYYTPFRFVGEASWSKLNTSFSSSSSFLHFFFLRNKKPKHALLLQKPKQGHEHCLRIQKLILSHFTAADKLIKLYLQPAGFVPAQATPSGFPAHHHNCCKQYMPIHME